MADSQLGGILPPEQSAAARREAAPTPERAEAVRAEQPPVPRAAAQDAAPDTAREAGSASASVREAPAPQPAAPTKDPVQMQVERMLENELRDLYFALPKKARDDFRARGESSAVELREMLDDPKASASAAEKIIHRWLKSIPNEHPLWLLQESKRKTDAFDALRRERHGLTE